MAPPEWDRIAKIDIEGINEDNADTYNELLSEIDVEGMDAKQLVHAFEVIQTVMTIKVEQANLLDEQVSEDKDKIKSLQNEKRELEKENQDLQRLGAGADDRELIQEKRNWEIERERLESEVVDLKERLHDLTKSNEQLTSDKADMTQTLTRMREDNEQLAENEKFLKTQNEQLRGKASMGAKGDDIESKKQLSNLRAELRAKKAQIDALEDDKSNLYEDVGRLQKNLESATTDMERATDEYAKMKEIVVETDHKLEEVMTENSLLKAQVTNLSDQLRKKGDSDDEIMVALNNKVEEWKQIISERDAESVHLYQENRRLKQDLQNAGVDSDRASVQALFKTLKEREGQIKLLTEQLNEATQEIQRNTESMAEMKKEMDATGRGPSDRQATRIRELAIMLKEKEERIRMADESRNQAEREAEEKDKELMELGDRMRRYEEGEYGLGDAVAEIKVCKSQIRNRDLKIEELCNEVNRSQMETNEYKLENEHLRTKMGIALDAKVDIDGYRRQKAIAKEEDKALSLILQKEIEGLEDERYSLKKKVRSLAKQVGHRAGSIGISADDAIDLDEFGPQPVEESMSMRRSQGVNAAPGRPPPFGMNSARGHRGGGSDTMNVRMSELKSEVGRNVKDLDEKSEENMALATKNDYLMEENSALQEGLVQLQQEMKKASSAPSHHSSGQRVFECPILEKLMAAMDARKMSTDFDAGVHMKARVDNLEGRNAELRSELREVRVEMGTQRLDLDKKTERLTRVEEELKAVNDFSSESESAEREGGPGPLRTAGLPEGMTPSSAETIAALNEHLIQVLHEISVKNDKLTKTDASLENYRRKFALCRHQQGLLYKEYVEKKKVWETEKQALEEKMIAIEGGRSEDQVRLQEFDRMLDTLGQEETEIKRRVGEVTRQVTVLRVNEKALVRRYDAVMDIEKGLRRENNRLKNEIIQMEATVTERLGYYQRYKEMTAYRVNALQKILDESVPRADLDRMMRKHDELTEKYRAFLESQNSLISRSASMEQMEAELRQTRVELAAIKKSLETEMERRNTLEVAWEQINSKGESGGLSLSDSHLHSISKKVTTLEMKELNERERADHATRLYENLKLTWSEIERRNQDLESKFSQLTKIHLEQQKTERELRDALSECVTKDISEADKKRVSQLEKSEMELKHEVDKLKEITDIASSQTKTIQEQQNFRDKEVTSLRQQLLDIQSQSDEKAVIGRLHRHIVQLQLSESTSTRKMEEGLQRARRLESQLLRLERKTDDKDMTMYHTRLEGRARVKNLKDTINSLRSQFAGSVPLNRQEKFTKTLMAVQEEKRRVEEELKAAEDKKLATEDELSGLKVKHAGLHELLTALKEGRGAAKVMEWHSKMENLRLEEMKQKRQVDRLRHQVGHLEAVIRSQEIQLLTLEEDSVRQAKEYEEEQLRWEQREVEMERSMANLESAHGEIVSVSDRLEVVHGGKPGRDTSGAGNLPDPNMPLAHQLDHAVAAIKKNLKTIFDQQAENSDMKRKMKKMEDEVKELERTLLKRERYINEMRLRLPATEDREQKLEAASAAALSAAMGDAGAGGNNYVEERTVAAAQTTVAGLQSRLRGKEESLVKYQEMLKGAREEMERLTHEHSEAMRVMQTKLNGRNDELVVRLQSTMREMSAHQPAGSVSVQQITRLQELEELLAEQNRGMGQQAEQIRESRRLAEQWKAKHVELVKAMSAEKNLTDQAQIQTVQKAREESLDVQQRISLKEREVESLEREVVRWKAEANKSPNANMKHLVERLKTQLAEKEREQKLLSKALLDLRRDMVTQAEESLKITTTEANHERDIQKVLDRHTKDLADDLEKHKQTAEKLRREVKKLRHDKDMVQTELDEVKMEAGRKDGLINRAKADRDRADQEVEELTRQIDRMKNMRRINTVDDSMRTEVDDLRRKNRILEDEIRKLKLMSAERPYEEHQHIIQPESVILAQSASGVHQGVPHTTGGSSDHLTRWEEGKKADRVAEKLRERLRSKDQETEQMARQLELVKNALERATRDKEQLEQRLTKQWGPGVLPESSPKHGGSKGSMIEELRERIHQLEAELSRRPAGERSHHSENEVRNRILQERIEHLERDAVSSGAMTGLAMERDRSHHKEVLRLNEENVELKFEVESSRSEIPRLKERVQELQKYVDLLKTERSRQEARTDRSMDSLSTSSLGIRKIGQSGKTPEELEKIIARLKRVVERTHAENERLKTAPGIVSNEQLQLLRQENDGLRNQLGQLRDTMGQKLAERYDAKDRGTGRLMNDHERLRKEMSQEVKAHEKARQRLRQLETELESTRREAMDLRSRLEIERAKRSHKRGGGGGGEGSVDSASIVSGDGVGAPNARMYEQRLRDREMELAEMKRMLKEATEREQVWLREKAQLQHKISVLERGSDADSGTTEPELIRQLRQMRVKTDRLEAENRLISAQLANATGTKMDDSMMDKLRDSEGLLSENVELRLQMKKIEMEKQKLQSELSSFGPDFFEEIEDLKFKYKQSTEDIEFLRKQLRNLSKQFGVSVHMSKT